jgi:hypothetical protein
MKQPLLLCSVTHLSQYLQSLEVHLFSERRASPHLAFWHGRFPNILILTYSTAVLVNKRVFPRAHITEEAVFGFASCSQCGCDVEVCDAFECAGLHPHINPVIPHANTTGSTLRRCFGSSLYHVSDRIMMLSVTQLHSLFWFIRQSNNVGSCSVCNGFRRIFLHIWEARELALLPEYAVNR